MMGKLRCERVEKYGNCSVRELWGLWGCGVGGLQCGRVLAGGVAVLVCSGVGALRCGAIVVWGSGVHGRVAVWGKCGVWELRCKRV